MPEPGASNCGLSVLKNRSRFQTTASALKGVPSWKATPGRSLKIQVFLSSGDCVQLSASPGFNPASASVFVRSQRMRPSKIG